MRACVIFNPVAKGQKAQRFRRSLDKIATECALKMTAAAGDARKLTAAAVEEGFETIIAAGGDGTVSEVLNGMGDAPNGFEKARLGLLPLGTVNVFARELGIPTQPMPAWKLLHQARESRIDLGCVDHEVAGQRVRHYFAQMAGAGLDARAIELVSWSLKKKVGPLAYVAAGLKALREKKPMVKATVNGESALGELVLIGNGRLYGGSFHIFPAADLRDGVLDVCVFPRTGWFTLLQCAFPLLLQKRLPPASVKRFKGESLTLTSETRVAFEIEGDLCGHLPATFSVKRGALRVLTP